MEAYEDYQLVLVDNHVQLVRDLNVKDDFLDELISEFIITHNEEELILSEKTRREQNKCFLKIIMHKGPDAFATFKKAIDENFHHLYNKLDETDVDEVRNKIMKSCKTRARDITDQDSNNNASSDDEKCEVSSSQNKDGSKDKEESEITPEENDKTLRQAILHLSSNHASVLRSWKRILRGLNLPEIEIYDVETQFRSDVKECVISGLNRWIDNAGSNATISNLMKALKEQGCRFAADDIQKRFLTS